MSKPSPTENSSQTAPSLSLSRLSPFKRLQLPLRGFSGTEVRKLE